MHVYWGTCFSRRSSLRFPASDFSSSRHASCRSRRVQRAMPCWTTTSTTFLIDSQYQPGPPNVTFQRPVGVPEDAFHCIWTFCGKQSDDRLPVELRMKPSAMFCSLPVCCINVVSPPGTRKRVVMASRHAIARPNSVQCVVPGLMLLWRY